MGSFANLRKEVISMSDKEFKPMNVFYFSYFNSFIKPISSKRLTISLEREFSTTYKDLSKVQYEKNK